MRLTNDIELTQLRTIRTTHISAKHQKPLLLFKVSSLKFTLIVDFPSSIRCLVTDMDTLYYRCSEFCWQISIIFALRNFGFRYHKRYLDIKNQSINAPGISTMHKIKKLRYISPAKFPTFKFIPKYTKAFTNL